jgi:hypothetical protein
VQGRCTTMPEGRRGPRRRKPRWAAASACAPLHETGSSTATGSRTVIVVPPAPGGSRRPARTACPSRGSGPRRRSATRSSWPGLSITRQSKAPPDAEPAGQPLLHCAQTAGTVPVRPQPAARLIPHERGSGLAGPPGRRGSTGCLRPPAHLEGMTRTSATVEISRIVALRTIGMNCLSEAPGCGCPSMRHARCCRCRSTTFRAFSGWATRRRRRRTSAARATNATARTSATKVTPV